MIPVPRQDRMFLSGLAVVALIAIFARPIASVLDLAGGAGLTFVLSLVPALIVLAAAFVFHLQSRREEARLRASAAEVSATQAQARAAEMERLVHFGQALGRSQDLESIRDVVLQDLPKLTGTREAWLLLRTGTRWQALVGTSSESRRDVERDREYLAERVLAGDDSRIAGPIVMSGHLCLPLTASGRAVGVLGIPEAAGPFPLARKRMLATAASLLAISLRNVQLSQAVRENSLRDALTGCFNRSHALLVIDTELRRARRSQMPVSLIMFDLDRFKAINDRYGHLCGDAVLAAVGSRMNDVLRGSDVKGRYGGEEFVVLLPETGLEGAKRVADTLRRELAAMRIPWQDEIIAVTASFGVTMALPSEADSEALIGRADAALYRAKDHGGNCVRLSVQTAVV